MEKATEAYRKWKLSRVQDEEPQELVESVETEEKVSFYEIEQVEQTAVDGLKNYILTKKVCCNVTAMLVFLYQQVDLHQMP